MDTRISLKTKIITTIITLFTVAIIGGFTMIWYSYHLDNLVGTMVNQNIEAYKLAASLETALINQKGFVSYYFIDKNHEWIQELGKWRQIFKERLKEAAKHVHQSEKKNIIQQIQQQYDSYVKVMDTVLDYYAKGEIDKGLALHLKEREHFFAILSLSNDYKIIQENSVYNTQRICHAEAIKLRKIAVVIIFLHLLFVMLLCLLLINQILTPLKELRSKTEGVVNGPKIANELKALSSNVTGLLKHIGETDNELKKSRGSLLVSEKMAMVGKLAAGVAHSVRNPLTSVKMRLFTLNRTLSLSDDQKEDFKVISEEIEHIDTIVGNFLEFSRPPKLQMLPVSPSNVVDMMMQLLEHRLKAYDVIVTLRREQRLPNIQADPEQLKEVLVNLMENACQAMGKGGRINISEEVSKDENAKNWCIIHIKDNGPGIPGDVQKSIFTPFYTTKGDGTGLGLSIAERIITNHGGKIELRSTPEMGTTFSVFLPIEI